MTDTLNYLNSMQFTSTWWVLGFPTIMMGLDILTGLIYAWISQTFDSSKMRSGLGKKFAELSYIVIGAIATISLSVPIYILNGIAFYIIFMELMSIIENCDKLGAPVPGFVKKVVNNINDSLSKDDLETIKEKLEKITT